MLNGMSVSRSASPLCALRTLGEGPLAVACLASQPEAPGFEGKAQPIENKAVGSASPMLRCRNPKQDSGLRKTKGLPESQGITTGAHFAAKLRFDACRQPAENKRRAPFADASVP